MALPEKTPPNTPPDAPSVTWRIPDVHPEGRKYVLIVGAVALFSLVVWDFVTWPLIGLTV